MGEKTITSTWLGGMAFGTDLDGHQIIIDAAPEFGGADRGPRPKPLMLVALAGCTGIDVVSILQKMRIAVEGFKIIVKGYLTDEHPKEFVKIHLIYEFKGKGLPQEKLRRAVELSQERYCGVSATYKKALELTWEIKIKED
jgi:putative redox protein